MTELQKSLEQLKQIILEEVKLLEGEGPVPSSLSQEFQHRKETLIKELTPMLNSITKGPPQTEQKAELIRYLKRELTEMVTLEREAIVIAAERLQGLKGKIQAHSKEVELIKRFKRLSRSKASRFLDART